MTPTKQITINGIAVNYQFIIVTEESAWTSHEYCSQIGGEIFVIATRIIDNISLVVILEAIEESNTIWM